MVGVTDLYPLADTLGMALTYDDQKSQLTGTLNMSCEYSKLGGFCMELQWGVKASYISSTSKVFTIVVMDKYVPLGMVIQQRGLGPMATVFAAVFDATNYYADRDLVVRGSDTFADNLVGLNVKPLLVKRLKVSKGKWEDYS